MRLFRSVALVVVLAVSTASGSAVAADPPRAGAAADAAALARRYYEDGVAAAEAKEWQKAHLAFAEAWRLKQHWQIAVNLGQAELRLGRHREAAEHLAYYLREATELHSDDVKQATTWLDEARAKVGILRLNIAPVGAQVFVDGKLVGSAPIELETYVDAGWHAVEARTADAKALRQVEAPVGQTIEVALGVGGAVPAPLPPSRKVAETTTTAVLAPRTLVVAGAGAFALVNLVVGAVTASLSTSKGGEQALLCKPTCPQSRATMASWNALEGERVGLANTSVAGFVLAGLAVAGSLTAFVVMKPRGTSSLPIATLSFSPTAGGGLVTGSF